MGIRKQKRVSERIQYIISALLQKRIRDPRLEFVTITGVDMSPDLYYAHVYFSVLGDAEKRAAAMEAMQKATGFFRRELGSRLALRRVPELTFHFDESLERGERIDALLKQIAEEHEHEHEGEHEGHEEHEEREGHEGHEGH